MKVLPILLLMRTSQQIYNVMHKNNGETCFYMLCRERRQTFTDKSRAGEKSSSGGKLYIKGATTSQFYVIYCRYVTNIVVDTVDENDDLMMQRRTSGSASPRSGTRLPRLRTPVFGSEPHVVTTGADLQVIFYITPSFIATFAALETSKSLSELLILITEVSTARKVPMEVSRFMHKRTTGHFCLRLQIFFYNIS